MLLKLLKLRPLTKFFKCFHNIQLHTSACYYDETSVMKSEKASQDHWEVKLKFWMRKYEDLFGITRLTEMHERVLEHQTKVQITQEKRRKVQEEIFIVQKKLQEMQDILHKTSMGDDMYISVVTQVRELLKQQKRLQDVFSLCDLTEKEQQTTLALAINNSQDQERTYREKNKYLSLLTGVIGGVLGILASSINNWRHRKDIQNFANDILNQIVDLHSTIENISPMFSLDKHVLSTAEGETKPAKDLVAAIKVQHELLDKSIKSLQSLVSEKVSGFYVDNENLQTDLQIQNVLNQFESNLDTKLNHLSSVNASFVSIICIFTIIFIYLSNNR